MIVVIVELNVVTVVVMIGELTLVTVVVVIGGTYSIYCGSGDNGNLI